MSISGNLVPRVFHRLLVVRIRVRRYVHRKVGIDGGHDFEWNIVYALWFVCSLRNRSLKIMSKQANK